VLPEIATDQPSSLEAASEEVSFATSCTEPLQPPPGLTKTYAAFPGAPPTTVSPSIATP